MLTGSEIGGTCAGGGCTVKRISFVSIGAAQDNFLRPLKFKGDVAGLLFLSGAYATASIGAKRTYTEDPRGSDAAAAPVSVKKRPSFPMNSACDRLLPVRCAGRAYDAAAARASMTRGEGFGIQKSRSHVGFGMQEQWIAQRLLN